MIALTLASPCLRQAVDVRMSIDAKLGRGIGLLPQDVPPLLSNPERVAWALGELLVSMLDRGFHRWLQPYAQGSVDGPGWLAGLAVVGRGIDADVAALLAWTAQRAAAVRGEARGEALFSVVPEVWLAHWTGKVPPFHDALVERWPDTVDPFALADVAAAAGLPVRARVAPQPTVPRYPQAAFAPEAESVEALLEQACYALWKVGASDDELDTFYRASDAALGARQLAQLCALWLPLVGDARALDARLFPTHPVAALWGLAELPRNGIVLSTTPLSAAARAAFARCPAVLITSAEDGVAARVRAALRQDPDFLVIDGALLVAADLELLLNAALTGHWVVVFGGRPELLAELTQRAAQLQASVVKVAEGGAA